MKASAILILLLAVLLSGCVNLKPKPDRTQIFALGTELKSVYNLQGRPEVYVTRVEIPGFLEGTRIHFRAGDGRLDSVTGARWAEAPAEALPRALAMHLQATGLAHVRAYYPWSNTESERTKVSVQFERFSASPSGQVEVVAQWQIESADGQLLKGRYMATGLQWDGQNVVDYIVQLDAGLAGLAEAIAQAL